ncbi:hypothetical protein OOZ15_18355 [Galbibacter sp. EGI 63066]|uniref:hypothetical protein n=1 Tax=Galbibacter sp. EGI 63066 TaxID=2993559 RepID=UPI0022496B0D|nr:hypothetical protein [Galbibacter sp. EGI 63066]MCX2681920.1 hypothetical protein [Galbibacter sp. EGI 63066]
MSSLYIFSFLLFTTSVSSQVVIHLGPFNSNFPDPLAHSQERRALSIDRQMIPKLTAMAMETQTVKKFIVDYENSLSEISNSLSFQKFETDRFLDRCIEYIVAKNSISGNIPGLSSLARKMSIITAADVRKIRSLKTELNTLFKRDNYMTEGERKVILLDIIDRAIKISIQ